MVNCDHCGKVFKYNCHLLRHLSSKTPCYSKPPPEFVDKKDSKTSMKSLKMIMML